MMEGNCFHLPFALHLRPSTFMTIASIREALRSFTQALQISSIFPATLFVWIQVYFLLPRFFIFEPTSLQAVSLTISSSLMISYLLYAFNFPLIRFLEGYKWQSLILFQFLLWLRRRTIGSIAKEIEEYDNLEERLINVIGIDPASDAALQRVLAQVRFRRDIAQHRCAVNYPSKEAALLPTRLGNIIAAWEEYSALRYGMDGVTLWPRLVPLLKKRDFLRYVDGEKIVFDFLLNLLVVSLLLGVEFCYILLLTRQFQGAALVVTATCVAMYLLYQALLVAARQWGTTVKVAFDLFRHDLHQQLGLKPQSAFAEDFELWQDFSRFVIYRPPDKPRNLFLSSKAVQTSHSQSILQ
jgi:hypothetical protein